MRERKLFSAQEAQEAAAEKLDVQRGGFYAETPTHGITCEAAYFRKVGASK